MSEAPEAKASALCEQCAPYSETPNSAPKAIEQPSEAALTGAETILVAKTPSPPSPPSPPKPAVLGSSSATVLTKKEVEVSKSPVSVKAFLQREGEDPKPPPTPLESGSTLVGSEKGTIRISSAALAPRHFRIEGRGNEFFLHDFVGSSGTFLNGYRVRAVRLLSGDRITAGNATFSFSVR